MGWREDYRDASFRGVPFNVAVSNAESGQNIAIHRFPSPGDASFRPPLIEPLGRREDRFQIEAFVLGRDYFPARRALVDALKTPGPGTLVHPYHGTLEVVVLGFGVNEQTDAGGMARFSITFIEAGATTLPISSPNPVGAAKTQAAALTEAAASSFATTLVTKGAPDFVQKAAEDAWASVWKKLSANGLTGPVQALATLEKQIRNIGDEVVSVIAAPVIAASALNAAFLGVQAAAASKLQAFYFYASFFGFPVPPPFGTGKNQKDAYTNGRCPIVLARCNALAFAVVIASELTFDSLEDALALRRLMEDELDDLADKVEDDVSLELGALRQRIVEAVPPDPEKLPVLDQYTPRASLPSLVLAQMIYADARRADEIVTRNKIKNPGLIPQGVPLEILVDG
jgi:prophage DNA circulation protein